MKGLARSLGAVLILAGLLLVGIGVVSFLFAALVGLGGMAQEETQASAAAFSGLFILAALGPGLGIALSGVFVASAGAVTYLAADVAEVSEMSYLVLARAYPEPLREGAASLSEQRRRRRLESHARSRKRLWILSGIALALLVVAWLVEVL